jgi:NAD(P)H-dependent FMN reductase
MSRQPIKILIFGAALRKDSLNEKLADLATDAVLANGATVERVRMSEFDCPSYDNDIEHDSGIPDGAQRLAARIMATDAFMIASPEYNASVPGHLKNVIDWASRTRPQPFNGKQALLLSASPSMTGGNRGLWALRIPLEHLGTRVYPDMFSLAQAHEAFAENVRIANDLLQKRLETVLGCFLDLVEAATHYPGVKKEWVEFLGEHPNAATNRTETSSLERASAA